MDHQPIDIFDPSMREDPFPTYHRMRSDRPVCRVEPGGFFALTRYDDITAAFRDTATYSSAAFRFVLAPEWVGRNPAADSLIVLDPPTHTRQRSLVSRAFVASVLHALQPFIEALMGEILEDVERDAGEPVDIVGRVGLPLAGRVIAKILGLDPTLVPKFGQWVGNISKITPIVPPPEAVAETKRLLAEQEQYLASVVDDRLAAPRRDDLPSVLCHAVVDGERLSREELISFLFILLGAGFETTVHLVSKSALLLADRPDLHQALRDDPSRVGDFVEEMLRYDGPTHSLMRTTTRDVTLHGTTIPAGSVVALVMAAGNRDPSRFSDPDTFDLDRKPTGVLAFGHGIHVCIGAALARMEGALALRALTQRFRRFERVPAGVEWNYMIHVRGLDRLMLRLHA
ncbi:cytochrome P450 [Paraliomyxa miuraensis]|uniref:cytochrome P450 n=1 Tax=Paraliomyxa miuraensis TaxID=376150 RepID=UPI002254F45C|nr:cytochrome P450 [Paraliomyxa miuraensis]MCX4247852.1 cytochrome P450 [Paraliomyxa miuraensis]